MNQQGYDHYRSRVFSMLHDPRYDAQAILQEHLRIAQQFEAPLLSGAVHHANDKTVNRRLRIGYASPDFRRHSVAYFIEPALCSHDRERFEIFCYSLIPVEDEVTIRLKKHADHWKSLAGISDGEAAECIRKDGIDILVDLAGHMYRSLLIFARKPAPIQVSWIGYPATTGFSTIDYKIVDRYTDPPGMTEQYYSEKLVHMPECFLSYQPDRESPEVSTLPALKSGEITFGSFNNLAKITPEVAALWSAILKKIPDSFLILKPFSFKEWNVAQKVKGMFSQHGIDSGRLELIPFAPSFSEHLKTYDQIDIALDPFPYNGVTTTCEALWMGVPVITSEGSTHTSRIGVSLLTNAGLPEYIAKTKDEYRDIALHLATNLDTVKNLRERLRDMMLHSPLTNAKQFTMDLENCYRRMWEKYCKQ